MEPRSEPIEEEPEVMRTDPDPDPDEDPETDSKLDPVDEDTPDVDGGLLQGGDPSVRRGPLVNDLPESEIERKNGPRI